MAPKNENKSSAMSSYASSSSGTAPGIATGIGHWYQLYDEESGRYFFFDKSTKSTAWGLPLKDCLPESERVPHGKGESDWVVCIDPQSGKKFFQSVKIKRVQWTPPLMFRPYLAKIPYFQQKRVSMVGAANVGASRPVLVRQPSLAEMITKIEIEAVLENTTTCAAFHRFLVATHAEENLLFWGAAEVFRTGEWKGMKVIGEVSEESKEDDDEGAAMLQSQMVETRASIRIGFTPGAKRMSVGREARMIFDKFLKVEAPMEVCVDRKIADEVLEGITSRKKLDDRSLFVRAQESVLRGMEEDLLPRFLRVALSETDESVGTKENIFQTDEVVRTALKRIAGLR